jgi:hypothetical protein
VGLAGLEPAPSSLSEIDGSAPCYCASSQAGTIRKCPKDEVNQRSSYCAPASSRRGLSEVSQRVAGDLELMESWWVPELTGIARSHRAVQPQHQSLPATPLSSIGPISRKVTPAPSDASTTS